MAGDHYVLYQAITSGNYLRAQYANPNPGACIQFKIFRQLPSNNIPLLASVSSAKRKASPVTIEPFFIKNSGR
jgi:hypothetical protein